MRRLPPALVALFLLAACSFAPSKPAEIPPAPIVESGANVPRDVSEDGLGAPQTSTAAVLVINKGIGSGSWMDGSGMVMWSSSRSSVSSWSSSATMGSGSSLSASGAVVSSASGAVMSSSSRAGSGVTVVGSGAVTASGALMPPASSSSSRSGSGIVASSSRSSAMPSSSSAMTSSAASSVTWEDDPAVLPPDSTAGGGVQPRRAANNLVITLETDYDAIPPGGLLQVSIPVRNFSAGPAEGFLVEATVPEGVTITDAVLGEIDGRSVRWRFNQLLQNQMYTLHFVVRAPRNVPNQTVLPFSARVSGGNLAGTAMVTTNVTVVTSMPQTGVDMGATLLEGARTTASTGQRTVLLVAALTALALMTGLVAGRVIASQRA